MNKLHEDLIKELGIIGEEITEEQINKLADKADGDYNLDLYMGHLEYTVSDKEIVFAEYFYYPESEFALSKENYND